MEREIRPGQFYRHFKNKLYQIIAVAEHSESGEKMVVYQALYGDFRTYVRPYEMFISETDHEKYPEVTQKYRFELINLQESGDNKNSAEIMETAVKQPEEKINQDLLDFLELETYEEKLEMFRELKKKMNDHLLDSIAASLDIVVEEAPLAQRYEEVLNCLETMEHFECNRFR